MATSATGGRLARSSLCVLCAAVAGMFACAELLAQGLERPQSSLELIDPKVFRVCADPHNMPFSTEQGRGLRKQACRVARRQARQGPRLCLVSAGNGLRAQYARGPPLRRHHGRPAGGRSCPGHEPLLPHGLRAGVQARARPRRRGYHGGSATEGQTHRRRGRNAAGQQHGGQWPHGQREALSARGRYRVFPPPPRP